MSTSRSEGYRLYRGLLVVALCVLSIGTALRESPTAVGATAPRSLSAIHSRVDFDSLAVTYDPDTPYALPHILFVIDRKDKNKIYYVNTKRYAFHKDFVNGTYLSLDQHQFTDGMSAGRGFIALAAIIFGRWDPVRAGLACLFFAAAETLQIQLQGMQAIPSQFVQMIPYALTIVALVGVVGRAVPPAALGRE